MIKLLSNSRIYDRITDAAFFMHKIIKNWILVFVWAGFIFLLSHQPFLESGLPGQWDFALRKIAHITEYAILTLLLIRALKEHRLKVSQIIILSIVIAVFYAISDEYHQTFILGRHGVPQDVLIDSLGIFLMAWFNRKKMIELK